MEELMAPATYVAEDVLGNAREGRQDWVGRCENTLIEVGGGELE
ncbi:hypothetical protein T4D_2224 [Trichinella pseudospiralis]|uniref:Uncharacterized protein n=1 Tax=Trichinella pseudospiralis TaxID=6337 RepID=A0A0V1DMR6_TRIPS|nr:hypothetical protein T4D_2224 [Trichinella pseudospiralis]